MELFKWEDKPKKNKKATKKADKRAEAQYKRRTEIMNRDFFNVRIEEICTELNNNKIFTNI